MEYIVCDLEANGLLYDADKVHCLCGVTNKGHEFEFTNIEDALDVLDTFDFVVFHNGYGYDLPLLDKLYHWQPKMAHDTMILSRMFNPDRMGGHSIKGYAIGYGMEKVGDDIEDWTTFSPEMLDRCMNDARVGFKIFEELKEGVKWAE